VAGRVWRAQLDDDNDDNIMAASILWTAIKKYQFISELPINSQLVTSLMCHVVQQWWCCQVFAHKMVSVLLLVAALITVCYVRPTNAVDVNSTCASTHNLQKMLHVSTLHVTYISLRDVKNSLKMIWRRSKYVLMDCMGLYMYL
jgi:hypothetical protein